MAVNTVAFCTSTALAISAGSAAFAAAAATASTVATVAYTILAVGLGGASIASVTAWVDPECDSVEKYFNNFKSHAGIAIAGLFQVFSQTMIQALIHGITEGVSKAVSRKIAGPDHTYKQV